MTNRIFRIAVIGAGETGAPLLEKLLAADFVTLVGVADLDADAPGMQIARTHSIPTTTNFMDLARLGPEVDVLIDVTGVSAVREQLRQHMQDSDNTHTLIVHEVVVQLLLSLLAGKFVSLKHGELDY